MRILFVSQEYPPLTLGGIGAYTQSIATRLAAAGHEVHVLSCVRGQSAGDELDGGVHVHRRRRLRGVLNRSAAAERLWVALSVRRELARLDLRPDVVEAPEYMAEALLVPRRRAPVVITLHTPLAVAQAESGVTPTRDDRLADRLERWSLRRRDVVTSPSRLLADRLQHSGWLRQPARVVPNPVDLESWSDSAAAASGPLVLAVGRIEARKAPEALVRAAALVTDRVPDVTVALAGRSNGLHDGRPYLDFVLSEAERLGVLCRPVGSVSRPELRTWYAQARVVAVPSRFDNYPMVVLEAMAAGRPVVATDSTGLADVLTEVHAGQVVPAGDDVALAEALAAFLTDPALAQDVGRRNRARVERLVADAVELRVAAYADAVRQRRG